MILGTWERMVAWKKAHVAQLLTVNPLRFVHISVTIRIIGRPLLLPTTSTSLEKQDVKLGLFLSTVGMFETGEDMLVYYCGLEMIYYSLVLIVWSDVR